MSRRNPALKWLREIRVGHLGTSSRNAIPLVVPVCFAYNGTAIYSVIDQKPKSKKPLHLRRVLNILENPNVCLVVDRYYEDWGKLGYVIAQGKATLISAGKEHKAALLLLRKKYRQYRYMKLDDRPVIRIKPSRIIKWAAKPSGLPRTVKPKEYD